MEDIPHLTTREVTLQHLHAALARVVESINRCPDKERNRQLNEARVRIFETIRLVEAAMQ